MIFTPTSLPGCTLIELEKRSDERGFFGRTWCTKEMEKHGLKTSFVQVNNSYNLKKGTVRGLHYQVSPAAEVKIVRVIRGRLLDVAIDLRPDSSTRFQHFSVELSADSRKMLYIPEGFAHGFQTLEDDTELLYFVSQFYSPEHERAIRWNDPFFKIAWPVSSNVTLSPKDSVIPDFKP
jgi:dTDP-4-dehydrorhamnose 3,5-epimerase